MFSIESSQAFVQPLDLPATASGPLEGLSFAIKDVMNIAGYVTGCGNPTWRAEAKPAAVHAVCVETLLAAGAHGVGKTITDEFAFSLLGENYFEGTPLNPHAPDRIPGGSSSGSASAVACGLADFSLGTDTGGSVRIPASYCGLWGYRPSHGRISLAGVAPLAPSFDTVGVFARERAVFKKVIEVLLGGSRERFQSQGKLYFLEEAWALVDPEVREPLEPLAEHLPELLGLEPVAFSLADLEQGIPQPHMSRWRETYCHLQWPEIWTCWGGWISQHLSELGPATRASFQLAEQANRASLPQAIQQREALYEKIHSLLGPSDFLCFPTAPTLPPYQGTVANRTRGDYYPRTLGLTAFAGVGRLPQISFPAAATSKGIPIGLSLLARQGQDHSLLGCTDLLETLISSERESYSTTK